MREKRRTCHLVYERGKTVRFFGNIKGEVKVLVGKIGTEKEKEKVVQARGPCMEKIRANV